MSGELPLRFQQLRPVIRRPFATMACPAHSREAHTCKRAADFGPTSICLCDRGNSRLRACVHMCVFIVLEQIRARDFRMQAHVAHVCTSASACATGIVKQSLICLEHTHARACVRVCGCCGRYTHTEAAVWQCVRSGEHVSFIARLRRTQSSDFSNHKQN